MRYVSPMIIGLLIIGGVGCTSARIPVATLMTNEQETLATLSAGRKLYLSRCSGCHALHSVTDYPPAEWPDQVADMKKKAKINQAEQDLITAYVVAAAKWEQIPLAERPVFTPPP